MKRTLPWILNLVLLAAFAITVISFGSDGGDDESPDGTTTTTTTTTTIPKAGDFISDGPHAADLREAVAEEEIDLSEWDSDEWELSVVRTVADNLMTVLTGRTIEALYESGGCDDDAELPDGYLRAVYDPGDWVLWSTRGDDFRICLGEVVLVKEN